MMEARVAWDGMLLQVTRREGARLLGFVGGLLQGRVRVSGFWEEATTESV